MPESLADPVPPLPPAAPAPHRLAAAPRAGIGAVLDIDVDAVVENWRRLGRLAGVPVAAVVKADAYGLGAAPIATALANAGAKTFFVAHLDEGIALRAAVPGADIFVLHGLARGAETAMVAHGLTPVLSTLDQIDTWAAEARRRERPLAAALHVDTGMARLGLSEAEIEVLAADPGRLAPLGLRLVMSHLAAAEEAGNPFSEAQRRTFERLRARLPVAKACLANSSGIFLGKPFHFDMVRPGAALYGIAPRAGEPNPMAAVAHLSARVLRVADLGPGTPVGYNGRFVTDRPTRIATVSVGYADGFFRALAGRAPAGAAGPARAGLDGVKLPIVGAVSMDMITVDVSVLPEGRLREGDFLDVIGGSADDVDTLARAAGTIGYEILTALGHRYQRRWLRSAATAL